MNPLVYTFVLLFAASTFHQSGSWLQFQADKNMLALNSTKRISLICSWEYAYDKTFNQISSISIIKNSDATSVTLANLSELDKDAQMVPSTVKGKNITVGYSRTDMSLSLYITVENPGLDDAGTFYCVLSVRDKEGKAYHLNATLTIFTKTSELLELCSIFDLNSFFPPEVFQAKKYYMSQHNAANSTDAQNQCMKLGGYLIEVDDSNEADVVLKLLKRHNYFMALIAGTDARKENEWIFARSGKRLQYLNWQISQPDNYRGNENCIYIYVADNTFRDIECERGLNFICEKE